MGLRLFFETKVANKNETRGEWCSKDYSKRFFFARDRPGRGRYATNIFREG